MLQEMSQRDRCEGIIQDAILLGTPVTGAPKDWQKLMRVVSGKIVNGYCRQVFFVTAGLEKRTGLQHVFAFAFSEKHN
jgi:hypothetical protein